MLMFYVSINLIGGERGMVSYFEKKTLYKFYSDQNRNIQDQINFLEKRNSLLSTNLDLDYIDYLYRQKFKLGKKKRKNN